LRQSDLANLRRRLGTSARTLQCINPSKFSTYANTASVHSALLDNYKGMTRSALCIILQAMRFTETKQRTYQSLKSMVCIARHTYRTWATLLNYSWTTNVYTLQ